MKETKKHYKREIHSYFDSISSQIDEIFKYYLDFEYSVEVECVCIEIYHGAFISTDSIGVIAYSNEGIEGETITDVFSSISPLLDQRLDSYDVEFEHRPAIFKKAVQKLFSDSWRRLVESNRKELSVKFYVMESGDDSGWCVNTRKYVKESKMWH